MSVIDWVKHSLPMQLKDGKRHVFPTLASMVYLKDGTTPITDGNGNWNADRALDAEKLGGKTPEAYSAVNLLDNSAFEIAQAGHGGMHGNTRYAADRWILSDAEASVSYAKNSGLTVSKGDGETYIEQVQPINVNENAGKKYSFAVNADGIVNILHATMPNAVSLDIKNGNILLHSYSDGLLRLRVRVDSSMTILWTALYEGIFTADTLPSYVPKGYANELLACNIADTGRVHDSDKLGGKAPEYYVQPSGLLINSDFQIAQAGYCKSNGTEIYLADGWLDRYGTVNASKVEGQPLNVSTTDQYGHFFQKKTGMAGKTITAFAYANGQYRLAIYNAANMANLAFVDNTSGELNLLTITHTIPADVDVCAVVLFPNLQPGGGSSVVYYIDAYLGSYNVETLPPYIPTHPRLENLKIGNPVQPVNLLDNSNFRNPVMQAGFCGYHRTKMYVVDRWDCFPYSAENYGFTAGVGISVAAGSAIFQKIADANILDGNTYTLVIWTSDGSAHSVTLSGVYQVVGSSGYIATHDNANILYIKGNGGTLPIAQVAVFRGSYTADTLPPYRQKGYAAELAECQRYYENSWYPLTKDIQAQYIGASMLNAHVDAYIHYKTTKRAIPNVATYPQTGKTGWRYYTTGWMDTDKAPSIFHRFGCNGFMARLEAAAAEGLSGRVCLLEGHWEAEADL